MKKYFALVMIMLLTLTGCGKYTIEDASGDFQKQVENSKSYKLSGTMEISSDEEVYTYSLETYFLKDDFYKVVLINQTNNHEQIILKNNDGLYVVTPNLNKSFKFDSVWPENSSQAYLLMNLVNDIKNDSEAELEEQENKYIIKSKVNYPNNEELKYQKIYFDKKMNIERVEVCSEDDAVKIKVNFKDVDMKAKLNEDDFKLDDLIDEEQQGTSNETNTTPNENTTQNNEQDKANSSDKNTQNNNSNNNATNSEDKTNVEQQNGDKKDNTSSSDKDNAKDNTSSKNCSGSNCNESSKSTSLSLESVIYPLYIPANTHLSSSETVSTETGERVILTFSGDRNFVLVEEVAKASNEFEIIPVFGDPMMLRESIGALSSNSVSWQSNDISYYLVGNDLSTSEMVSIATSLGNASTVISVK